MVDNPRIEDLRRRVQKDPASIAFAQLAEEYRRAGLHQEAVDACCAGLVLHPGYLSARVTLGRSLIELGDLDQAERELETVLKSAPENLSAIRGIADIHHKREALGQALEYYRTALALARNDPDLEQTVVDLAQRVAPTKRAEPKDGLSLEQMQREMTSRMPAPTSASLRSDKMHSRPLNGAQGQPEQSQGRPFDQAQSQGADRAERGQAPAPPASISQTAVGRGSRRPQKIRTPPAIDPERQSSPNRERAVRVIAALEQWLHAIHVTRAIGTS